DALPICVLLFEVVAARFDHFGHGQQGGGLGAAGCIAHLACGGARPTAVCLHGGTRVGVCGLFSHVFRSTVIRRSSLASSSQGSSSRPGTFRPLARRSTSWARSEERRVGKG